MCLGVPSPFLDIILLQENTAKIHETSNAPRAGYHQQLLEDFPYFLSKQTS